MEEEQNSAERCLDIIKEGKSLVSFTAITYGLSIPTIPQEAVRSIRRTADPDWSKPRAGDTRSHSSL